MSDLPVADQQDAAWVSIDTPFDGAELRAFLEDVERLFRINSMLVFEDWSPLGARQFAFRAKNLSNGKTIDTVLRAAAEESGIRIEYEQGLRTSTSFRIEEKSDGTARLVVTDDYSGSPLPERKGRIDEVDKSLINWGNDLYRYLQQWKRWSWVPGWQLYMRKVWQPMRPMGRRIAYILFVVTIAEIILFFFVFAVFSLELSKYLV